MLVRLLAHIAWKMFVEPRHSEVLSEERVIVSVKKARKPQRLKGNQSELSASNCANDKFRNGPFCMFRARKRQERASA
ncbi:hypothetical protein E4U36_007587 [Claviceps purpurea]|nr:hypothetical protein E4U51_003210 [Claviceps purpurea]KAG6176988.1 hypothetical protein E4U36_007587 [Claviceps purpurea]KAG6271149.1 hypothetical protein E4U49_004507 [Claviceps purpurea]